MSTVLPGISALVEALPFTPEGRERLTRDLETAERLMAETAEELAEFGEIKRRLGLFVALRRADWPPLFAYLIAIADGAPNEREVKQLLGLSALRVAALRGQTAPDEARSALPRPVLHMQVALEVLAILEARLGDAADPDGRQVLALAMLALHPDTGGSWFTPART